MDGGGGLEQEFLLKFLLVTMMMTREGGDQSLHQFDSNTYFRSDEHIFKLLLFCLVGIYCVNIQQEVRFPLCFSLAKYFTTKHFSSWHWLGLPGAKVSGMKYEQTSKVNRSGDHNQLITCVHHHLKHIGTHNTIIRIISFHTVIT